MSHRIRLKKPWSRCDQNGATTTGVDVPDCDTTGSGKLHACSTYRRRFNRPTGIEPADRLELEIGEVRGQLTAVRLNQAALRISGIGSPTRSNLSQPHRVDITQQVLDHNELEIEIHAANELPRLVGPVNLWIT